MHTTKYVVITMNRELTEAGGLWNPDLNSSKNVKLKRKINNFFI